MHVHQQHHGYVRGHQLLATSLQLDRADQEVVDRLSDIAGSQPSGVAMPSYLTGYPLPSKRFFVLARTWLDTASSRAGCVLTHSLLVPLDRWVEMRQPSSLKAYFRHFPHADRSSLGPLQVEPAELLAPEPTRQVVPAELIEALFLEERRPILWVAENPEEPILRIIDALWPSLRSNFAFQSYSLKPRSIGDRPFDLMAAPRIARGRFADWSGRKVEGDRPARHSWTNQLSREIFEAAEPDLTRADPLGILLSDERGESGRLRLSLLWNDLSQARQSPAATLGMLDILAASSLPPPRIAELVEPIVLQAVSEEVWGKFQGGAARFIVLLLEKLEALPTSPRLDPCLASAVSRVMRTGQQDDFEQLVEWVPRSERYETLVDMAILESLASFPTTRVARFLEKLPAERALRLLDSQPTLAEYALRGGLEGRAFAKSLASIFPHLTPAAQEAIRSDASRALTKETAKLIRTLTKGLDAHRLGAIAHDIIELAERDRPAVWREFWAASVTPEARAVLLQAAVSTPLTTQDKARLLAENLQPTFEELDWLLTLSDGRLAVEIARQMTWADLGAISSRTSPELIRRLVALLVEAEKGELALSLLEEARFGIAEQLDLTETLFDRLPDSVLRQLVTDWLSTIFPVRSRGETALARRVLEIPPVLRHAKSLSSKALVEMVLPRGYLDRKSVRWTLDVLISALDELKSVVAKAADKFAERLIEGPHLDEEGYANWAKLVQFSCATENRASIEAARKSLEFALRQWRRPVSELIKASFPIVYPFAERDPEPVYTGFFSAPIDRSTSMRRDLADAYFSNAYLAPKDLAIIAVRTEIADQIFSYVGERWGGRRYLQEVFDDLDPRRGAEEKAARKKLRSFIR